MADAVIAAGSSRLNRASDQTEASAYAARRKGRASSPVGREERLLDVADLLRAVFGTPRNLVIAHQRSASSRTLLDGIRLTRRVIQTAAFAPSDELLEDRPREAR
jgi:hypothetical protein